MLTEALSVVARSLSPPVVKGAAIPESGSVIAASVQGAQDMPRRGTRDLLQLYKDNPLIHMVASKVGDLSASTNWRVGIVARDVSSRTASDLRRAPFEARVKMVRGLLDSGELEEIDRHPFLDLIAGKNSMLLGRGLRKVNQIYMDLVGETYNLMEVNGFRPTSLEPVPPTCVLALPTADRPFYKMEFGSRTVEVPAELVFCVRDVDPLEPYGRGVGKGRALADEIETDEYTAKWLKNHFRSGARPDFIIASESMNQPEALRIEKTVLSKFRDFRRSFMPWLLRMPRDGKIVELANSFNSGPIVELRNRQRDFILQVFSISPEVFGILTNSNRATSVEARHIVAEQVQIPRNEVWREAYQERLLPLFDERLVIWYDDPRPEDEDRKIQVAAQAPYALTIDEHRILAGHEPKGEDEGGSLRPVPNNFRFVGDLAEVGADAGAAPPPPVMEDEPELEVEDDRSLVRAHQVDPYELFERALERMEGALAEAFREAVDQMRDAIDLALLEQALAQKVTTAVEAAIPFVIMSDSFIGDYDVWSLDALRRFGQIAANQLEDVIGDVTGLDLLSSTARDWAQEHGAELVREITSETRNGLLELIRDAFEERVSRDQLARQIRGRIGLTRRQTESLLKLEAELRAKGLSEAEIDRQVRAAYRKKIRARAKLIARQETVTAGNQGQEEVFRQARNKNLLPPNTKKEWLLSPAPCEICIAIEANGPVEMNKNFVGGGVSVPHPGAHIACICSYRLITVDPEGGQGAT